MDFKRHLHVKWYVLDLNNVQSTNVKILCDLLLCYSHLLQVGWYGDHISLWSQIFRTHPEWPRVPPHLLYDEYQVSFPGLKGSGSGVHHPPYFGTEVEERLELCLYSSLCSIACSRLKTSPLHFCYVCLFKVVIKF